MKLLRYRGLLVIALWQAPVGPVARPDGSIGLLFGGGFDEATQFDCNGPNTVRQVRYRMLAAEFDYNVNPRWRVEGVAGALLPDAQRSRDSGDTWLAHGSTSLFAGVQLRADGRYVGVGGGVLGVPRFDPLTDLYGPMPSAHLRLGPAETLHARADLFPPVALGTQQQLRLGAGWNATRRDRVAGLIGVGVLGAEGGEDGIFGELMVPVHERMAVRIVGHTGQGVEHRISGFAVGGRLLFR